MLSPDPTIPVGGDLPPTLSWAHAVISRWLPAEAARMAEVLPVALARRLTSGGDWGGSTLTMPGDPLEIAFATHDPLSLRYTIDPGVQDLPELLALWHRLGAPALPSEPLETAQALWRQGQLRFHAFIGVRHRQAEDRFKLYLEVPEQAASAAEAYASRVLECPGVLPNRPQRVEMIGVDPTDGRIEIYGRITDMMSHEVGTVLWRGGLAHRKAELLELLSLCFGFPIQRDLPGSVFGYSYARAPTGPVAVTLYTHARTLFGREGSIRSSLLSLGRRYGWDLGLYADLSAPLANLADLTTRHTMFGITLVGDAPPTVSFGLAPPEESCG